jgi:hypothetical protein
MPSPTEEIFTEISKDFNVRCNFPNCVRSKDGEQTESNARPSLAASILTTNSAGSLFCRLL